MRGFSSHSRGNSFSLFHRRNPSGTRFFSEGGILGQWTIDLIAQLSEFVDCSQNATKMLLFHESSGKQVSMFQRLLKYIKKEFTLFR